MALLNLMRPLAVIVILFWLMDGDPVSAAAQPESLDRIRAAAIVQARTEAPTDAELKATSLDSRLHLPTCPVDLATRTVASTAASINVEVRCDAAGWKLFVPVGVRQQVQVLIAARPLARGESVGVGDVELQSREVAGLGTSWMASTDQLEGRVLSRAVPTGAVLLTSAFVPARLIRRGQAVTLVGISGGFQIRAEGKALADGAAGEFVRVENLGSRRVVEGKVRSDGTVQVGL
ncbi:MAG: flagellar basal body P-ring formation chaperone FlgA [Panacagrimonas sp.]